MKKHQHKLRKDLEAGGMSRDEAKETMKGATGEHNSFHRGKSRPSNLKKPRQIVAIELGIVVARTKHKQRSAPRPPKKSRLSRHKR